MNCIVSIIIVTHNSQSVLPRCIEAIDHQTVRPYQVIVVDSGSDDSSYLDEVLERDLYEVKKLSNVGFAAANNKGLESLDTACDYVLFINPDTFLSTAVIEKSLEIMERLPRVAILTGLLEGFDFSRSCKTGKIDSTGIFRTWYGRWYDRGKGEEICHKYQDPENVPAVCGALMFARTSALRPELPELFDESFFMYKEDIELSVRLSEKGWELRYSPEIRAFHCRGWKDSRRAVPRNMRIMSAKNEIKIYQKHPSIYMVWAQFKYLLVRIFNI